MPKVLEQVNILLGKRYHLDEDKALTAAEQRIVDIYLSELQKLVFEHMRIKNLIPQEHWDRYALFELNDLPEVVLLRGTLERIRLFMKERPKRLIRSAGRGKKSRFAAQFDVGSGCETGDLGSA